MATPTENQNDERYRQEMARFILPPSVIATMESVVATPSYGEERSIHHDHWLIRLGDPSVTRDTDFLISFDAAIDAGERRLNAIDYRADYAVKKVMVLTGLAGTHGQTFTTKTVLLIASRKYDWFVRWRIAEGVQSNDELNKSHFESFTKSLIIGDVLDFVPIEARLESLVDNLRAGRLTSKDLLHSPARGISETINWEYLAGQLGVTSVSLSRSADFKLMLFDGLSGLPVDGAERLARLVRLTTPRTLDGLSQQSFKNSLVVWNWIHRLGTTGAITWNTLQFDPFEKKSISKIAKSFSSRHSRTKTILPEDFYRLITAASTWLLEHHEYIEFAVTLLRSIPEKFTSNAETRRPYERRLDDARPQDAPYLFFGWSPDNVRKDHNGITRLSIGYVTRMLMASAMIVIGCYSPRRGSEITKLKVGCVERTALGH